VAPSRSLRRSLVAAAVVVGLAGCSATNPIQTDRPYSASDGVRVELGDVRLDNLLAVTTKQGAPGALSGAVTNDGGTDATVTLTVGDAATSLDVPAHGAVLFGTGTGSGSGTGTGEAVPLASVDAAPGALLAVSVTAGAAGTTSVQVPVLDGGKPPYDAVLAG
jgi:hypothetical protein